MPDLEALGYRLLVKEKKWRYKLCAVSCKLLPFFIAEINQYNNLVSFNEKSNKSGANDN